MALSQGPRGAVPTPNSAGKVDGATEVIFDANGYWRIEKLLYIPGSFQNSGLRAIGAPYFVNYSGNAGQELQAGLLAAATSAATSGTTRHVAILTNDAQRTGSVPATGTYGWFAVEGTVDVLVEGTVDVAKSDFLKVNSNAVAGALIKDSTTRSDLSVGIARAAQTADSAVSTSVFLIGEKANIA